MNLKENMSKYIGQTVTIFTTSGGQSGSGFTGVLISVSDCSVRLLVCAGEAPACPLGSSCSGRFGIFGRCNKYENITNNQLGAITVIPIRSIAAFTHNAI